MDKPVPMPTPDTAAFWEGCRQGELRYQTCRGCGHVQFYPRARCTACHGSDLDWAVSAGRGTIHSFTVVHRAPSEAFKPDVPYVLALVDLAEGFRMMLNVTGADPDTLEIGTSVEITFEPRGDQMLPQAQVAG